MTNMDNFTEKLKNNPRPVIADFWAPWCGPCRAIEPMMRKLSADYAGRVDVWKINADEDPDLLRSLGIYGIPTLVAFHNGQEVARRTGATFATLQGLFEAALSGDWPVQAGPAPLDRVLRLAVGTSLFILALRMNFSGLYPLLAGLGALVAFSAVHDRCPLYRAISSRLTSWRRKDQPG